MPSGYGRSIAFGVLAAFAGAVVDAVLLDRSQWWESSWSTVVLFFICALPLAAVVALAARGLWDSLLLAGAVGGAVVFSGWSASRTSSSTAAFWAFAPTLYGLPIAGLL